MLLLGEGLTLVNVCRINLACIITTSFDVLRRIRLRLSVLPSPSHRERERERERETLPNNKKHSKFHYQRIRNTVNFMA